MDFITGEILYIDKPLKWTSFDVVKRMRGIILRRIHRKKFKVGHAGTLDPLATGVMIVCTGKATKQIEALQAGVKEYVAEITFGATTPSYDLETEINATFPIEHISLSLVEEVLKKFTGEISQVPPAFSACKIDGHRAYKMARRGEELELKAKALVRDEIELLHDRFNNLLFYLAIIVSIPLSLAINDFIDIWYENKIFTSNLIAISFSLLLYISIIKMFSSYNSLIK